MLRGLVIRQGFVFAEGVLGLVIIAIALLAIRDLYFPAITVQIDDAINESTSSAVTLRDPVGPRQSYQSIIASKIFGNAAGYVHNKPPVKRDQTKVVTPPKVEPVEETKLPIKLIGTLAAGKNSRFSSATIEITGKDAGKRAFFVGDDIIKNVRLTRVAKNKIWIDNKGKNEILSYKLEIARKSKGGAAPSRVRPGARPRPTPARSTPSARPTQQKLITIDRGPTIKKLESAYKRLASTIDVLEVRDDDGKLLGLSTPNIESIPELAEFGFKNGDVLVSVNNEKVTSQNQITSLANKYKNASVVRIAFLRDNQLMNTTYRLR